MLCYFLNSPVGDVGCLCEERRHDNLTLLQGDAAIFKQHMRWCIMLSLHRLDCLQTILNASTSRTSFRSPLQY